MDKFGIFKLLGSFMDYFGKVKPNNDTQNPSENKNVLDNLLGIFNKQNNTPSPSENKKIPVAKPLQSSMLSTMNNHDNFVKRVKAKNSTVVKI